MKILQLGPLSYTGGVSIHINRLRKLLSISQLHEFYFIDESPINLSKGEYINIRNIKDFKDFINLFYRAEIIHIHSVHWLIRLFYMILAFLFRKKMIITLHSFRINHLKRKITLYFLKKAKKIIVVNSEINKILKQNGINAIIKEAFIPPFIDEELELPRKIQNEIKYKRGGKSAIICANAFRLTPLNGKELYGLDQCIEVAKIAKNNNLPIFIIFVISTRKENDLYYDSFANEIEKMNLQDFIFLLPQSISFINLIKESDIVLRPTLSDGDALTIREALYFNKKVIASDVVKRPPGTLLYSSGNVYSLYETIKTSINNHNLNQKMTNDNTSMDQYYEFYYELYRL